MSCRLHYTTPCRRDCACTRSRYANYRALHCCAACAHSYVSRITLSIHYHMRVYHYTHSICQIIMYLIYQSMIYPIIYLFLYLSIYLSIYLFINQSNYLSIYLSNYLSIYPIYLSVYPPIDSSIFLSAYLSIRLFIHLTISILTLLLI